jgi:hypothetical protein
MSGACQTTRHLQVRGLYYSSVCCLPQENLEILRGALPQFQHVHQRIRLLMTVQGGDHQQISLVARLRLPTVSEIWQHCLKTAEMPQVRPLLDLLQQGSSIYPLSR